MNAPTQAQADPQRVLAALMGLHRAWPLERRIRQEACDSTRETYLAVLLRWVQAGVAPTADGFDREALEELVALDAIFPIEERLSCPPFSASATDIAIHFPHETVYALSALDALAVPRLVGAPATIETHCVVSNAPLTIRLTQDGALRAGDVNAARVIFRKIADRVDRYALHLAPGMRFVSVEQALPQTLSLPEALAVANAFYGFQRALIRSE